jgi:alpha-1,6-mannosyltransferase
MARFELWHICAFIFPCLAFLHLYISPFTKVEESFNMQAAHDILMYGIPTRNIELRFKAQYDHMEFPGAVPRTFIGALVLAGIAEPMLWLRDRLDQQMVVRTILGAFNALSLIAYSAGVNKAFGKRVAAWFVLLQASQFHVFYYASRTLPNMFAFGISTPGPSFLISFTGV